MIDWLVDPLGFEFFLRALLAAVIVGIVCSVLGTYIVLQGMAFFGDALAHTILPGVVAAFLLGLPLAIGALIMGIFTPCFWAVSLRVEAPCSEYGPKTIMGALLISTCSSPEAARVFAPVGGRVSVL